MAEKNNQTIPETDENNTSSSTSNPAENAREMNLGSRNSLDNGNGSLIGTITDTDYGKVKHISIVQEMEKSYLDYAMSVIVSRALPDVRDGLKPVQRRILYSMSKSGIHHNTAYKKCARIVGDVLGKYHPHGDSSVYMALVRLAQDFNVRYPLVDGQGNFGSIDGDSPAAMRYTEARLAKISQEILDDFNKNTVKFVDNFDGSLQEPAVLPGKLPNLLLMGAEGIAVGMATKIPPHNLEEVCQATIKMIQKGESTIEEKQGKINQQYKKDLRPEDLASLVSTILDTQPTQITGQFSSEITNDEIMEHIQGPDFPTGGIIYDFKEIKEAYSKGKGKVVIRGKAEIVENKGNFEIVITEIPYQVNKALMIEQIANLVKNDKIDGIRNIRDDSDRQGLQITIELRRSARPKVILNKLYKFSKLQTSYPMNMVALNSDGTPQLMNIKQILSEYVRHRQLIIVKRSQYDLVEARNRAHILEGLIIALNNLDEVIDTIRKSADSDVARVQLMKKFGLSEIQAVAILEMQLKRLAALERKKIEEEYESIKNLINQIIKLLTQPQEILGVVVKELEELVAVYGDKRLTKLIKGKIGEMSEEDLVPNAPTVITLTKENYIKRLADKTFRSQKRGGKGVKLSMKDEDVVETLITCENHDSLLFFTNLGRVFKLKAFEIPESSRTARGTAIVNLLSLKPDEKIQSILQLKDNKSEKQFIVLATKKGLVKKTAVSLFDNIRATGIIAISLNKDDELVKGRVTNNKHEIFLATRNGKCIRFDEKEIKASNRDTKGVRGITLKKDDYLVALESIDKITKENKEASILVITEKGMGKRTTLDQYPVQKRSGLGVKVADITKRTGQVATVRLITEKHKGVVISTKQGQTIHLPNTKKSLPFLTRPTQGVILMKLDRGDEVAATALTEEME